MVLEAKDFWRFYIDKSRDVINNRNFFEAVYLTSLISVLLPLIGSGEAFKNIFNNFFLLLVIIIALVSIAVLVYVFGELKYKEYRLNYMTIVITELWEKEISIQPVPPRTYSELANIIHNKTLFSKRHIMPILRIKFGHVFPQQLCQPPTQPIQTQK